MEILIDEIQTVGVMRSDVVFPLKYISLMVLTR